MMAELSLFFAAFAAATLLPFSSEAAFVFALSNEMSFYNAMIFASSGNVLAIIVNYYLGYFLYKKTKKRLFKSRMGVASYMYGHKYGYVVLLFSWLPIIGDPLTLVAGLLRLEFVWFVIIAGSLRVLRYYFLAQII